MGRHKEHLSKTPRSSQITHGNLRLSRYRKMVAKARGRPTPVRRSRFSANDKVRLTSPKPQMKRGSIRLKPGSPQSTRLSEHRSSTSLNRNKIEHRHISREHSASYSSKDRLQGIPKRSFKVVSGDDSCLTRTTKPIFLKLALPSREQRFDREDMKSIRKTIRGISSGAANDSIKTHVSDPESIVVVRRPGEGSHPLFDRDDLKFGRQDFDDGCDGGYSPEHSPELVHRPRKRSSPPDDFRSRDDQNYRSRDDEYYRSRDGNFRSREELNFRSRVDHRSRDDQDFRSRDEKDYRSRDFDDFRARNDLYDDDRPSRMRDYSDSPRKVYSSRGFDRRREERKDIRRSSPPRRRHSRGRTYSPCRKNMVENVEDRRFRHSPERMQPEDRSTRHPRSEYRRHDDVRDFDDRRERSLDRRDTESHRSVEHEHGQIPRGSSEYPTHNQTDSRENPVGFHPRGRGRGMPYRGRGTGIPFRAFPRPPGVFVQPPPVFVPLRHPIPPPRRGMARVPVAIPTMRHIIGVVPPGPAFPVARYA